MKRMYFAAILAGLVVGAPAAGTAAVVPDPFRVTHGDPLSVFQWKGPNPEVLPGEGGDVPPACASDYYFVGVLAYATDSVRDETVSSFRTRITTANTAFYNSATANQSNGASLKFACVSGTANARIDTIALSHPSSYYTSFGTIANELFALGYNRSNEKYVVWYESTLPGTNYCGQGSLDGDSSDSVANANDVGPDYAINYDCDAILHEVGHTIGAVQNDAPHSSGAGHCYDENDVMCYDDGGPYFTGGGALQFACAQRAWGSYFDCNFDDYFNSAGRATPSTYIGTHWNIGECYMRWVQNYSCP